jgi:hypothetical protein
MQYQLNVQCLSPGQLTVRPGTASIAITAQDTTNQPVVSVFRYQLGVGEHLVYQDALGRIFSTVVTGGA